MFDAYVINIDSEKERWDNFIKNNKKYNIYFNFIRYSANYIKDNPIKGCFQSHIEINKICSNNYYFVFEDDTKILPQFDKIFLFLKDYINNINNNWEIFNFNPNCTLNKNKFNIINPNPIILEVCYPKTTNFLLINKNITFMYQDIPFDHYLAKNYKTYTFYPYCSTQIPGNSSILNKYVDYSHVFIKSQKFIKNLIDKKTVNLLLQGRIGNRIFQLFTALKYCKMYNKYLKCYNIKPLEYESDIFNKIIINKECNIYDIDKKYHVISDKKNNIYNEININKYINKYNVIFDGYFQNINNIEKYSLYLNLNYYSPLKNIIGIHLRRGDYIKKNKTYVNYTFYQSYNQALLISKSLNKKFNILIFTDDIEYCKIEIDSYKKNINNIKIFIGNDKDSFENMMRLEYLVLSNSTFSWMAAYLSKNLLLGVMPDKWLKKYDGNPGKPNNNIIITKF